MVRLIIREMKREGGKWTYVHILKHHMYLFLQRLGANLAFSQEKYLLQWPKAIQNQILIADTYLSLVGLRHPSLLGSPILEIEQVMHTRIRKNPRRMF